mmetsp:Transcript_23481/g.69180  ORF Transcript_23481/g.69180 Transcript_23481/m.69180 type:complete len:145 (-) Transcript_23481:358-792(-)
MVSKSQVALFGVLSALAAVAHGAESVPGAKTTYEIIKSGAGPRLMTGDSASVHATGRIAGEPKHFWSSRDNGGTPFAFTAGLGHVIKGWDKGVIGMYMGEIRKLTIPSEEAYGEGGYPAWGIPKGATLEFEIEIISIAGGHHEL